MPPFDFPSSPSEGQIFNAPSGPTYVFNTPVWRAVGQGQIAVISDAAPANPANGQLWLESDTGILFVYWNDGNSSQWVQVGGNAASGAIVTTVISTSGTYTPPAGLRYLEVTLIGAGGGVPATPLTGAGAAVGHTGGGGGGTAIKLYAGSDPAISAAYTIGAGTAAATGGTSTFAGLTAAGGAAGVGTGVGTTPSGANGPNGGAASGGDINMTGGSGGVAQRMVSGSVFGWAGDGGDSFLTARLQGQFTGSISPAAAGVFPGGGARGGCAGASQAAGSTAAGGSGGIIFKEYY